MHGEGKRDRDRVCMLILWTFDCVPFILYSASWHWCFTGAVGNLLPQTPMHHLLEVFENTVKLDNNYFLCHGKLDQQKVNISDV